MAIGTIHSSTRSPAGDAPSRYITDLIAAAAHPDGPRNLSQATNLPNYKLALSDACYIAD